MRPMPQPRIIVISSAVRHLRRRAAAGPQQRIHTFAERHIARYARHRGAYRALDLLLAVTPSAFVSHLSQHYRVLPIIERSLVRALPLAGTRAAAPVQRIPHTRELLPAAKAIRQFERITLERIRLRSRSVAVVRQFERIEVNIPPTPPALRATALGETLPRDSGGVLERQMPVATAIRRSNPAADMAGQLTSGGTQRSVIEGQAGRDSTPSSRNPPHGSLAEAEIERVTHRVIQSIDRRIVAHRERLGKP